MTARPRRTLVRHLPSPFLTTLFTSWSQVSEKMTTADGSPDEERTP